MCQQLDPGGRYSVPDSFTSYSGVGSGHKMVLNNREVRERETEMRQEKVHYSFYCENGLWNLNSGLMFSERCSDIDQGCSYYTYCEII